MDQNWSARAYRNGDEEQILELYSAVFGEITDKNKWLNEWKWKYKQNPAGEPIIWVACCDNKIVAQYAIAPVKIKFGDRTVTAAQSVDTMTHPDYQGRGIFVALTAEVFKEAARRDVAFIYGFPNKLTSWHEKNWHKVGNLSFMIKPVNINKLVRSYIVSPKIPGIICAGLIKLAIGLLFHEGRRKNRGDIKISKIKAFDQRADKLWANVSGDYQIRVLKNKEYLDWRYTALPGNEYEIYAAEKQEEIRGYLVFKCMSQRGLKTAYVLDLIAPLQDRTAAYFLVKKALEDLREKQVDIVAYPVITSRNLKKTLHKTGIFTFPFLNRIFPFVIHASQPEISESMLRNPENWLVQIGDSDIM